MKEIQSTLKTESIIGATSHLNGKLRFNAALRIKGKFDGEITNGGDLNIEESSIVKANIHIRSLDLYGTLIGHTHAQANVHIYEKSHSEGDIYTKSISIAQGAKLKGHIHMLENSESVDIFSAKAEQLKKLLIKDV